MKSYLISTAFLVAFMCLLSSKVAQALNIDSLLAEIESAEHDTTKVAMLFNVIIDMRHQGDDRMLATIRRAQKLSESTGVPKLFSRANFELGLYHEIQGSYDSAFYYYERGLEQSRKAQYQAGVGYGYYFLGSGNRYKGDNYTALQYFDTAVMIFEELELPDKVATSLFGQAVVLDGLGELDQSIEKFYEALALHEQVEDDYGVANCYNSIGILNERTGNLNEAKELFEKSLKIFQEMRVRSQAANCMDNLGNVLSRLGEYDEALVYHDLALKEREELGNRRGVARSYLNLTDTYAQKGEHDKALESAHRSLEVALEIDDKFTQTQALYRVSHAYRRLGDLDQALKYGLRSLALADSIQANNELMEARRILSEVHRDNKDYEAALDMYIAYATLKDSILSEENLGKVKDLEAKYQNAKKEEEIKLKEKEKQVLQASLSSRNFQIALVIALLLIALGVIVGVRNRAKAQRVLADKEHRIDQQRIKELEQEQKILFMDAMITGQEEERKRVAKDLHDGLGVLLSTVQMHFTAVQEEIRKLNELDVYGKANKLLDEACGEVRKIAHNMMPSSLTKFGLPEALNELCNNLSAPGKVETEIQTYGLKERLPEKFEIMLYRIAQEALNNSIKYSEASKITVDLSKEENEVHLVIVDNGKGFEAEKVLAEGGHGLNNIHSRVKYLNGVSELQSKVGEGTTWDIKVPLS